MLIHSPGSKKKTSHFTILQKVDTWSLGHDGLIYLIASPSLDQKLSIVADSQLLAEASFFCQLFFRMPVRTRKTNMTMKQSNHLKTYLLWKKPDFPLPMLVFRSVPPVLIDLPFRTWWFVGSFFEWTESLEITNFSQVRLLFYFWFLLFYLLVSLTLSIIDGAWKPLYIHYKIAYYETKGINLWIPGINPTPPLPGHLDTTIFLFPFFSC